MHPWGDAPDSSPRPSSMPRSTLHAAPPFVLSLKFASFLPLISCPLLFSTAQAPSSDFRPSTPLSEIQWARAAAFSPAVTGSDQILPSSCCLHPAHAPDSTTPFCRFLPLPLRPSPPASDGACPIGPVRHACHICSSPAGSPHSTPGWPRDAEGAPRPALRLARHVGCLAAGSSAFLTRGRPIVSFIAPLQRCSSDLVVPTGSAVAAQLVLATHCCKCVDRA